MKTSFSIPDDLFERAERLAKKMNHSRSELYSRAVAEYVARHSADEVTEALNAALEEIDQSEEGFTREASIGLLRRTDW